MTPDQLKQHFRANGMTFTQWAKDHGYRPNQVLRVLNGFDKCTRGAAHDIAVKLGLKPDPSQTTT